MRRFNFENTPLQDTVISNGCKDNNFQVKICDFFLFFFFFFNIDCGYTDFQVWKIVIVFLLCSKK